MKKLYPVFLHNGVQVNKIPIAVAAIIIAGLSAPGAPADQPSRLTFEDRVRAQEAIERVYYSH